MLLLRISCQIIQRSPSLSFSLLQHHSEITCDPCNLIDSHQWDLSMNRTISCSKLHFFPVNSTAVLKHDNRLDFNVYLRNQSNCRKMKDNFLHFRKRAWYWMNKMFVYLKKKPYFSNWIFLFQNIGKKVYCGNWTLCWANQSCTVCMFDFEITHMISD